MHHFQPLDHCVLLVTIRACLCQLQSLLFLIQFHVVYHVVLTQLQEVFDLFLQILHLISCTFLVEDRRDTRVLGGRVYPLVGLHKILFAIDNPGQSSEIFFRFAVDSGIQCRHFARNFIVGPARHRGECCTGVNCYDTVLLFALWPA